MSKKEIIEMPYYMIPEIIAIVAMSEDEASRVSMGRTHGVSGLMFSVWQWVWPRGEMKLKG